jgi:putative salt-induced outer membrane protein YdiY
MVAIASARRMKRIFLLGWLLWMMPFSASRADEQVAERVEVLADAPASEPIDTDSPPPPDDSGSPGPGETGEPDDSTSVDPDSGAEVDDGAGDDIGTEDGVEPGLEPVKPRTPRADPALRSYYLRNSGLGSPSGPRALKKPERQHDGGAWKSEIEVGATGYRGNNDSELFLLRARTERKRDEQVLRLAARASVGNKDGERDRENGEVEAALRNTIHERWYYTAEVRYFTDAIADVDYQFVSVLSPGYDVIRTDTAHLALEIGPAYIAEKKGDEEKDFAAARFAIMMDKLIDARVLVWERFEYLPALEDAGVYLILAEVGVETALTDWFRLRTVLQQRYDSTPAEDKEKQDLFLSASLVAVF